MPGSGKFLFGLLTISAKFIFIIFSERQKTDLFKCFEKILFWTVDDDKLNSAKGALLSQIDNLDLAITANGFFILNRQFLATVRFLHAEEIRNSFDLYIYR